jgi:bifunctional non-homologous end joining protein LigD
VLVQRDPDGLTLEFSKSDRGSRILIDIGRNGPGATTAAPYAIRPKPGAPVSAPCSWEEIEQRRVQPQSFTLRGMAPRLAEAGDLWFGMARHRRSLRGPVEALKRLAPR